MPKRLVLLSSIIAVALVAAACGGSGDDGTVAGPDASSGGATRTVEVTMVDIAYKPARVAVKAGETVRFVFRNEGKVAHDAFLGDEAAQAEHEKQMSSMTTAQGMGSGGTDGNAVTVEPGKTATITRTFRAGDNLLIGCHQPGHYAAGMKLAIDVS